MIYLNNAILIFVYMNVFFILALTKRNNSIVDIGWGLGFILIAFYNILISEMINFRQILTFIMILLWGLRLSIYIYSRNKGKAEDFRYSQWRKDWGKYWLIRSYLQVFILQGFFMFAIVYPILMLNKTHSTNFTYLDGFGIIVWLTGFVFESVADYQKNIYKQIPENWAKVMDSGLWKYSRHPNYFGESLMWWGIFFIVLNLHNGFWAIISPLIITILLTKVSGIPLIEKHHQNNPAYQDYKSRTSAFFPWKPKNRY